MVTKDLVDAVVGAANEAISSAQAVGNAEVEKEVSDEALVAAKSDNDEKVADLTAAEGDLVSKKAALDDAVAALTASF
jgi:hypothetical protein